MAHRPSGEENPHMPPETEVTVLMHIKSLITTIVDDLMYMYVPLMQIITSGAKFLKKSVNICTSFKYNAKFEQTSTNWFRLIFTKWEQRPHRSENRAREICQGQKTM